MAHGALGVACSKLAARVESLCSQGTERVLLTLRNLSVFSGFPDVPKTVIRTLHVNLRFP